MKKVFLNKYIREDLFYVLLKFIIIDIEKNNEIYGIRIWYGYDMEGYLKLLGKDVLFNEFRKIDYLEKRSEVKIKFWLIKDLKVK